MRDEVEKLAATGKLNRHHIEALVQLTRSGYCLHRSWGVGKITTVDTVFARFTIDFQGRAGHGMEPMVRGRLALLLEVFDMYLIKQLTAAAVAVTVAINVTASPKTDGFGAGLRAVDVLALLTVCVKFDELLALKLPSPL